MILCTHLRMQWYDFDGTIIFVLKFTFLIFFYAYTAVLKSITRLIKLISFVLLNVL